MVLTLVQGEVEDFDGVRRQGGSGVGGGTAAGRHHAAATIQRPPLAHRMRRTALECVSCSRPVTGAAVVLAGAVYCTWDCAVSIVGTVPGQYFG